MNLKKWILAVIIVLGLLVTVFLWIASRPPPAIPLPNPNGYVDLVQAGQILVGDLPDCYSTMDDECLEATRAYLKSNGEALKLARLGLSRESRIPMVYSTNYFYQHLPELSSLKRWAQIFTAEGTVAEKENRLDDAIQSYVDAARINGKMRGGVMIDGLVGITVESIGIVSLRKLSDQMTPSQRRHLIENLAELFANRDSYHEIMARERRYAKTYSLREQFAYVVSFPSRRKMERSFHSKLKFARARVGLLLVDLALRNFESENGAPPKTLQELVPKHLPFLPKDDFSGNDFIYRPATKGYTLYGVGSDGVDDGGKPFTGPGMASPGDMLPDSQW